MTGKGEQGDQDQDQDEGSGTSSSDTSGKSGERRWLAAGVILTFAAALFSTGVAVANMVWQHNMDDQQNRFKNTIEQATEALGERQVAADTPRLDMYDFIALTDPPAAVSMHFRVKNDGNSTGRGCELVDAEATAASADHPANTTKQVLFRSDHGVDTSDFSLDADESAVFGATYTVDSTVLSDSKAITIKVMARCKTPNSTASPELITIPILSGVVQSGSVSTGEPVFATGG